MAVLSSILSSIWVPLLSYIITSAGEWFILEKAGESGWKGCIPVYRIYILFKLFWEKKYFFLYLAAQFVFGIAMFFAYFQLALYIVAQASDNGFVYDISGIGVLGIFLVVLWIINLILKWLYLRNITKAFGAGTLFTVGMFFFPGIFMLILGLSDKYFMTVIEEPEK